VKISIAPIRPAAQGVSAHLKEAGSLHDRERWHPETLT